MAVIECKLHSRKSAFNYKGENLKTLIYLIDTDVPTSEAAVYAGALASSPHAMPALYAYLGDGCYVLDIELSERSPANYTRWMATVTAQPLPQGESPGDGDPGVIGDPLKRRVVYWIERAAETEILEKDRNGLGIFNSAGRQFDEPPTWERHYPIIVARRNFATWEEIADLNATFENAVNGDVFKGRPVETVKYLGGETGPPEYENNIEYYACEFRFQQRPSQWKLEILSRGWEYWTLPPGPGGRRLVTARDDEGQLVTEPVLLAADGTKLPEGAAGIFLTYKPNPLKNFSSIIDINKTTAQIIADA